MYNVFSGIIYRQLSVYKSITCLGKVCQLDFTLHFHLIVQCDPIKTWSIFSLNPHVPKTRGRGLDKGVFFVNSLFAIYHMSSHCPMEWLVKMGPVFVGPAILLFITMT